MTRALFLVTLFILISFEASGQCVNGPTVTLSSTSGNICGITPVTIAGNTFGGSATMVTITENGSGSVSPTSIKTTPFNFTYTPKNGDAGKVVIITVTTNNPSGSPCTAAQTTYTLSVNSSVTAPAVGKITQPSCSVPTGSVALSGLPSTGTWTITRLPDMVISTGTGTSVALSGIPTGTYNFTVSNSAGCSSSSSKNVVITSAPGSPASPAQSVDCSLGAGNGVVTVVSPVGTGLEYRLDALAFQSGTSFINVADGPHTISVRNASGCISTGVSFQVSCACVNPPTLTLTRITGQTCGTVPVTVTGNTFGGSATGVTITSDGTGTVSPASTSTQPFAFTYTPSEADVSKLVTITVKTDRNLNSLCTPVTATFTLTVNPGTLAPIIGSITEPTCTVSTGSVNLTGLPLTGTWELIRSPGGVTTPGSGGSAGISGLPEGTYTYTVTNSSGCISPSSNSILITAQPAIPAAPLVGTITAPTCFLSTGSVVLNGLPATGTWTLTRYPGTVITTGTGVNITIPGLSSGLYNYTVTSSSGCASALSANVTIPDQPATPAPPLIGTITQPASGISTGSVILNGLPAGASWTLTLTPGNITTTGSGATKTITGLVPGTYSFKVTNSDGCTSGSSASFEIYASTGTPVVIVTNPPAVCYPSTADLTNSKITEGSSAGLTYTYWTNAAATIPFNTPSSAPAGTYYIKGATTDGYYIVKPVTVTVYRIPLANAGPDQVVSNQAGTTMNAEVANSAETGVWSIISGGCEFSDATNAKTPAKGFMIGRNVLLWTVTNGVCPSSSDTVMITIYDLFVPTLITPNMDGKNDYLIVKGTDFAVRMELIIFDRRGAQVYKNANYDNSWNGVDYNGRPLSDDTYFYVLRSDTGINKSGYIVIRK